jgi:NitT/TauT family transport system substrate-binding protein
MYTGDGAKAYAEWMKLPAEQVLRTRAEFYPKANQDPYVITGLEEAMADAVEHKFIQAALTKEQIADLIQIPPK